MKSKTESRREILHRFLSRWSIEAIEEMTLEQYVSLKNKDTFCQWIETQTEDLGRISGMFSTMFGIWKRATPSKIPKGFYSDAEYSWAKFYGSNRDVAFGKIKKEILKIIDSALNGRFEQIDDSHLNQFVRWKIAYLFSNERLIPIFYKDWLILIGKHYGLDANKKTPIAIIQNVIIENKPAHLSIYDYAEQLYLRFGKKKEKKGKKRESPKSRKPKGRKASGAKNPLPQQRSGSASYIANQKHDKLQEALISKLKKEYGEKNVLSEEDYVDIKVITPDKIIFYEVKSSPYASDCIIEALGQILGYVYADEDARPKELVIAGESEPNKDDVKFIKFLKTKLNIDFSYLKIELE